MAGSLMGQAFAQAAPVGAVVTTDSAGVVPPVEPQSSSTLWFGSAGVLLMAVVVVFAYLTRKNRKS